jgi:hypothetical protein
MNLNHARLPIPPYPHKGAACLKGSLTIGGECCSIYLFR